MTLPFTRHKRNAFRINKNNTIKRNIQDFIKKNNLPKEMFNDLEGLTNESFIRGIKSMQNK